MQVICVTDIYYILIHSHPDYQINNWDCGFYQLKALLKEFMQDDLKAFRILHKQLGDKIRQQVYELGFLK